SVTSPADQSFSPLFIGEYSATPHPDQMIAIRVAFQSPLHRGILCNHSAWSSPAISLCLSVPSSSGNTLQLSHPFRPAAPHWPFSPLFIGEYSATALRENVSRCTEAFQSPLHRGILCNDESASELNNVPTFQSPLHRGILCNFLRLQLAGSAGEPFSPLFIGEYSATLRLPPHLKSQFSLSVPSSSGNTLQLRVLLFRQREQLPF